MHHNRSLLPDVEVLLGVMVKTSRCSSKLLFFILNFYSWKRKKRTCTKKFRISPQPTPTLTFSSKLYFDTFSDCRKIFHDTEWYRLPAFLYFQYVSVLKWNNFSMQTLHWVLNFVKCALRKMWHCWEFIVGSNQNEGYFIYRNV